MNFGFIEIIKSKVRGTFNLHRLIKDGLKVGSNFDAMYDVIIDPGHCWLIEIGDNVTLAPRVHILAHDASMKKETGYTRIAKVKIGNNVFIGAGSIILPGVEICDNVVIGAGSIVTKKIEVGGVYVGNPARLIMPYEEWIDKIIGQENKYYKFNEGYQIGNITDEKKEEMKKMLTDSIGFIV